MHCNMAVFSASIMVSLCVWRAIRLQLAVLATVSGGWKCAGCEEELREMVFEFLKAGANFFRNISENFKRHSVFLVINGILPIVAFD